MIEIKCYKLTTPICGKNYFNGGNGSAREYDIELFNTKSDAEKALELKKKNIYERMKWCDWWLKKYATDKDFTIEEFTLKM